MSDELTLPFIFVADGADPPPELAAFKAANLDWVSFPATFIPHEQPEWEGESLHEQPAPDREWTVPPRKKRTPPQPAGTDPAAVLRAFQRARAAHPDPVSAMRALRDAPEMYDDRSAANELARARLLPRRSAPSFAEATTDSRGSGAHDRSDATRKVFLRNEEAGDPPANPSAKSQGGTPRALAGEGGEQPEAQFGSSVDGKNIQLASNDGTPLSNQAQNAQVSAVVRILDLTPDQRQQLHREISGQNFGFQEILETARDMFGK